MIRVMLLVLLMFHFKIYSQQISGLSSDTSYVAFKQFINNINRFRILKEFGDIDRASDYIYYTLNNKNQFVASNPATSYGQISCKMKYSRIIAKSTIERHLLKIYTEKNLVPKIRDFHFSEYDKQKYKTLVKQYKEYNEDGSERQINKTYLNNFPVFLDTITEGALNNLFNRKEFGSNDYNITFYSNEDSFTMQNISNEIYNPWLLPFVCQYRNCLFKTYNIDFGKFLSFAAPNILGFYCSPIDNADILLIIAMYFTRPDWNGIINLQYKD